jgi:beta-glucanase (GH16 family)
MLTCSSYTNQPAVSKSGDEISQASLSPSNLSSWSDWHTHRIDWLPKHSYWYLDGTQTAQNTYSVPRRPSGLILNMWSDGGEWSGTMKVGDSAEFQIMWIEMVFNTSGPVEGVSGSSRKRDLKKRKKKKKCEVVCKIDGVEEVGVPEVVSVNKSVAAGMEVSWMVMGLVAVMTTAWVGL